MRIDEHGRWVSDDGAYVWDEAAQAWQPSAPRPTGSAGSTAAPATADPATDGIVVESTGAFSLLSLPRSTAALPVADDLSVAGVDWPRSIHDDTGGPGVGPGIQPAVGGEPASPGGWDRPDGTLLGADLLGTDLLGTDLIGTDLIGTGVPAAGRASGDPAPVSDPIAGAWLAGAVGEGDIPAGSGDLAGADVLGGRVPGAEKMSPGLSQHAQDDRVASAPGWDPAERDRGDRVPAAALEAGARSRAGSSGARTHGRRRRATASARATRSGPLTGPADGETRGFPRGISPLPRSALIGGAAVLALLLGFGGWLLFGHAGGHTVSHGPAKVAASVSAGYPRQYSGPVRTAYLDECVQVSGGLRAYCACTLEKLEATYPEDQYVAFNNNVNSSDSTKVVREIADQCVSAG